MRWLADTALFFHGSSNSTAKLAYNLLMENAAPIFMLRPERLETNGRVCVCVRRRRAHDKSNARCKVSVQVVIRWCKWGECFVGTMLESTVPQPLTHV